jgi:hypothetical protein
MGANWLLRANYPKDSVLSQSLVKKYFCDKGHWWFVNSWVKSFNLYLENSKLV